MNNILSDRRFLFSMIFDITLNSLIIFGSVIPAIKFRQISILINIILFETFSFLRNKVVLHPSSFVTCLLGVKAIITFHCLRSSVFKFNFRAVT